MIISPILKSDVFNITLIYAGFSVFSYLAFVGFLGAVNKRLFMRSSFGKNVNHTGKRAIFWGLLIFIGMITIPMIILIKNFENIHIYVILLSISAILAVL